MLEREEHCNVEVSMEWYSFLPLCFMQALLDQRDEPPHPLNYQNCSLAFELIDGCPTLAPKNRRFNLA